MNARQKLNSIAIRGSLTLAVALGLVAHSWAAFALVLVLLLAAAYHDGAIRFRRHRR